jgi:O-antigen/teichoic acid export membrane protein
MKLFYLFKKNISLFIIVISAFSFFISNILLKKIFSPTLYGEYSIIITFLTLMFNFGILGLDQVLIRLSRVKNQTIDLEKYLLRLIVITATLTSLSSVLVFRVLLPDFSINYFFLFLTTFAFIGTTPIFAFFRLTSNFVIAQVLVNFWRIMMLPLVLIMVYLNSKNYYLFIYLIFISIIFCFLIGYKIFKRKIKLNIEENYSNKEIRSYFLHFFVSILLFSFLTYSDKFFIQSKFGIIKAGEYFYISNFFLAPYSILQNYIGFKQLIVYKNNFIVKEYVNYTFKSMIFGLLLGISIFSGLFLVNYFEIFNFNVAENIEIALLLILFGIVRLYASSFFAVFEAIANESTIKKSNLSSVIGLIIILGVGLLSSTLIGVLLFIIFAWIVRVLISQYFFFKQN